MVFYAVIIILLVGTNLHRFRRHQLDGEDEEQKKVPLSVYAAPPGRADRVAPVITTVNDENNSEETSLMMLSGIIQV